MTTRKNRMVPVLLTVASTLLAAAVAMAAAPAAPQPAPAVNQTGPSLLEAYKGKFLIGTAGDPPGGFSAEELNLVKNNFNILTPENYLKPAPVHPLEDVW